MIHQPYRFGDKRAFTLIEMLVVISIIAVLASMILVGAGMIRQAAKRNRTEATLTNILSGVQTWAAEYGGLPSPVEHPLAGSSAPRSLFQRASGSNVSTTGQAFIGVDITNLAPAAQNRLLLADDRFADPAVPGLYGLPRSRLGVLGGGSGEVTNLKQLPYQPNMGSIIANPDLPDVGTLVAPPNGPGASDRLIRAILGKTGHFDELLKQGALWFPPDDLPANLVFYDRVWSCTAAGVNVPGTTTISVGGTSHHYRLRGPGFYDAWGNEILISVANDGRNLVLISAGRDGHFQWHPGDDGSFQTSAIDTQPSGNDKNASSDNVMVGGR